MDFAAGGLLRVRITPADVGKRVSVRVRTPPGERPPGYADTVGVLTSWTGGVLRLTRRDGRTVELPEAAVVAAKVVPPAPARRRGTPAAGLAELTAVAARSWPATEQEPIGGWTARAAAGWTRRANSAVRTGEGAPDLARLTAWYAARGLPPRLRVATGAAGADELLDAELAARGWRAEGSAVLQVAALAPLADQPEDERVTVGRELTAQWLRCNAAARRDPATARRVLTAGPSVWFAGVPAGSAGGETGGGDDADHGGAPLAAGRVVVDGRWAGFTSIEVNARWRRRGLATTVMAALARVALAEGASAAHLQVAADNDAARAFYQALGFSDHHHYHYRTGPDDG